MKEKITGQIWIIPLLSNQLQNLLCMSHKKNLTAKEKFILFFFTFTHTLIISLKGSNTLYSLHFIFFSMHSSLSGLSSFSKWLPLSCSLNSLVLHLFLLSLCGTIYLFSLVWLFNMQHPHVIYIQKSFCNFSIIFLVEYEFLTWLELGLFWPTRS